jgi:cholesterol oxidase
VVLKPETEVTAVSPRTEGGYTVLTRPSLGRSRGHESFATDQVVFAGGVLGTVPLLLAMRAEPDGLPALSPRLGQAVRSNNEALVGVIAPDSDCDFTEGVSIGSILHTDDHSHFEAVHNGQGSSFLRMLILPYWPAATRLGRVTGLARAFANHPVRWARAMFQPGLSSKSVALVTMQTLDSTLSLRLKTRWRHTRLVTEIDDPVKAPTPYIEAADDLVRRFAEKVDGVPMALATELVGAIPTTAHVLGGCCMGEDWDTGVIDARHRVHGYPGLYVIDGSAMSANPGVNPSLSITALAERALSFIPPRS